MARSKHCLPSVIWLLFLTSTVRAQVTAPVADLATLKGATVFVKNEASWGKVAGTGFLIRSQGKQGYVVTNQHVIAVEGNVERLVSVVFDSGTQEEESIAAEIVAEDASRDLAILRVEMKARRAPISLPTVSNVGETLPVFILGFPFGEALSLKQGNPAVTISRGAVSSIRRDDYGNIFRIQIDGGLNPGNSGGPIVDQQGSLIGIAVARVVGSQIGFAIPACELNEMLLGRVSRISLSEIENSGRRVTYRATIGLVDPMGRLKGITLLTIDKDRVKQELKPSADGRFGMIARGMKQHKCKISGNEATVKFTLAGQPDTDVVHLFQLRSVGSDGHPQFTVPKELAVHFGQKSSNRPEGAASKKTSSEKDDWLGRSEQAQGQSQPEHGGSVETGKTLAASPEKVVDADISEILLPAAHILPDLQWSADARSVFVLEENGLLRKISVPGFVEQGRISIGQPCSSLVRSAEGLVVGVTGLQELWVIDGDTLSVKGKVPLAGLSRVTSSASLSVA